MTRYTIPLCFLFACADSPGDPAAGDESADDTSPAGTNGDGHDQTPEGTMFQPVRGDWEVLTRTIISDACDLAGYVPQGEPGALMTLGNGAEDDRFVIEHSDGTLDNCILVDDIGYDCLNREDVDDTAEAIGALIVLDIHSYGGFGDSQTMFMDVAADADCEGGGCFLVELATGNFPCYFEMSLEFAAL